MISASQCPCRNIMFHLDLRCMDAVRNLIMEVDNSIAVRRPQRWNKPMDASMDDADVLWLRSREPFASMDAKAKASASESRGSSLHHLSSGSHSNAWQMAQPSSIQSGPIHKVQPCLAPQRVRAFQLPSLSPCRRQVLISVIADRHACPTIALQPDGLPAANA